MENISIARTNNGRLIEPDDIQLIMGFDKEGAIRDFEYVRKICATGSKDLLLSQYCQHYGLGYREVRSFLRPLEQKEFTETEY